MMEYAIKDGARWGEPGNEEHEVIGNAVGLKGCVFGRNLGTVSLTFHSLQLLLHTKLIFCAEFYEFFTNMDHNTAHAPHIRCFLTM